ncbi:hypothetical protein P3547_19860 [Vibrio parahaemolyticus]|nr:hypothetical protein [Vibrio parahaemolyticus]
MNLTNKRLRILFGEDNQPNQDNPSQESQTITLTEAELQERIDNAVNSHTSGLVTSRDTILGEKKAMQGELEKYRNMFAQFSQDQEFEQALAGGDTSIKNLLNSRVEQRDTEWREKLDAESQKYTELEKQFEAEKQKMTAFQVDNLVRQVALKNEFIQPTALDDILNIARNEFTLTESGELVALDKVGNIRLGKDGKPLGADEFIRSLADSKPHYFKAMNGTGTTNAQGASIKTMSKAEWQNAFLSATGDERKAMIAGKASGAIVIS